MKAQQIEPSSFILNGPTQKSTSIEEIFIDLVRSRMAISNDNDNLPSDVGQLELHWRWDWRTGVRVSCERSLLGQLLPLHPERKFKMEKQQSDHPERDRFSIWPLIQEGIQLAASSIKKTGTLKCKFISAGPKHCEVFGWWKLRPIPSKLCSWVKNFLNVNL